MSWRGLDGGRRAQLAPLPFTAVMDGMWASQVGRTCLRLPRGCLHCPDFRAESGRLAYCGASDASPRRTLKVVGQIASGRGEETRVLFHCAFGPAPALTETLRTILGRRMVGVTGMPPVRREFCYAAHLRPSLTAPRTRQTIPLDKRRIT